MPTFSPLPVSSPRIIPARALTFVDDLEAACAKLLEFPRSGADRSHIRDGLWSKLHGSYVIFYTVGDAIIRIDRILHGARDVGTELQAH